MKNAMLNGNLVLAAVTAAIVLTGCQSTDIPQNGTTTLTVNNSAPVSGGVNCTMTPNGSGGAITTCDNGMTVTAGSSAVALFKGQTGAVGATGAAGAAGTNGAVGATGPQGPAGTSAQRLAINVSGTYYNVLSYYPPSTMLVPGNFSLVLIDSANYHSHYDILGNIRGDNIYFTTNDCTGTAYAYTTAPLYTINEVIQSSVAGSYALYKIGGDPGVANIVARSQRNPSFNGCTLSTQTLTNARGTLGSWLYNTSLYTGGELPFVIGQAWSFVMH